MQTCSGRFWVIVPLFLLCFSAYSLDKPVDGDQPVSSESPMNLSLLQLKEDLDYTVRIMKNVHPATYRGLSAQQKMLIESAYRNIQKPQTATSFFLIINSLLCSFQDAHTTLRMRGANPTNRQLDVNLLWLHDGFCISEDRHPFQRGDRVVAIGDLSMDRICQKMQAVISGENEFWRNMLTASLVRDQRFLEYLQVLDGDKARICVERENEPIWLSASLKPAATDGKSGSSRPWIGYDIDENISLGIFYFDTCALNDEFRDTLKAFFSEAHEKRIKNIAVDLRRNSGGVSAITQEIFQYIDIDRYKIPRVEMRYSREIAEKTGYSKTSGYIRAKKNTEVRNRKKKDPALLFRGKLFVLTSALTFSSANYLATTIRDNNLGIIVGEPTGNAPTAYGDAPEFSMPNTGLIFAMSHKKFTRPNPQKDPEDSLYPDVPVYTTIRDLVDKRDPQVERLRQIVEGGGH